MVWWLGINLRKEKQVEIFKNKVFEYDFYKFEISFEYISSNNNS